MDRQVVYPGAIPFDTDLLLQNRNTMIGIGYLAKMVVGDSECYADGLGCMPGNALSVVISPGSLTFPAVVDSGFIGSMPPDGDPLVKIGINTSPTVLPVSGAGTFLLSASFAETQAGDAVVPYYNAANPAQTLFGADGDGNPQASVVQQRVSFALNSGLTPPSGAVPLWVINVPVGATAIDSSMIGLAPGAPFLAVKLPNAAPLTSPSFIGQPNAPTPASGDLSTLLATTAFVSAAARRYRKVWRSAGTSTWVCPAGVTQILFRGWGPGGAGGTGITGLPGGGGGGGGYLEVLADVVAGQSYAIVVGTGGTITVPGTATSFGGALSAFSGSNGGNGGSGVPGVGGSAGGDAVLQLGALSNPGCTSGQAGYLLGGSNVGGAAGQSFGTGSSYPTIGSGAWGAGIWPGGGGAGGANGGGGNGAVGLVILEWCGNPGT